MSASTPAPHLLRALRHRNFALFISGQAVSLIGAWMQRIAMAWLVYRLTHSVFMLGLVGFVGQIPTFVLTPFAGLAPFGSLMAGSLGSAIGVPHTLLLGGCCCVAGAVAFACMLPRLRRDLHPLYVKLGILGPAPLPGPP